MEEWQTLLIKQVPVVAAILLPLMWTGRWLAVKIVEPLAKRHLEHIDVNESILRAQTETLNSLHHCLKDVVSNHTQVLQLQKEQSSYCRERGIDCPLKALDMLQTAAIAEQLKRSASPTKSSHSR